MTLRRLRAVAHFAFREVLNLRVGWIALASIGLALAAVRIGRSFHFDGDTEPFAADLGCAVVRGVGTLLSVLLPTFLCAGARIRGIGSIFLSRGVSRGEWLLAHWAAVVAALVLFVAMSGIALHMAVAEGAADAIPGRMAVVAVELIVTSAATLFVATLSRGLVVPIIAGIAFALAADLASAGAGALTQAALPARLAWNLAVLLLPDFSSLAAGEAGPICAVCGYAVLYVAAAMAVFSRREL